MKTLLCCAAGLAALAASSAFASETAYDLWRSVEDGQTVVAVAESRPGGAYAVAAGKTGALDVLAGEAAEKAMKDLRAKSDLAADGRLLIEDKDDGQEIVWTGKKGAEDASRIVIRKKEIVAGENGEERIVITKAGEGVAIEGEDIEIDDATIEIDEGKRVEIVRVEKRAAGDDHGDHADRAMKKSKKKVILLEGDDDAAAGVDGLEKLVVEIDGDEEGGTRFLRIAGAGADAVKDFIDDMDGLDASEKRALQTAVGL